MGKLLHVWMYGTGAAGLALLVFGAPNALVVSVLAAAVMPMLALVFIFMGISVLDLWKEYRLLFVIGLILFAAISYAAFKGGGNCESEMNMAGQIGCVSY